MKSPGYTYQHRARRADDWTSTTAAAPSTSASITGLDQTGYQVRISATNFEGDSRWSQITVGDLPNSPPTVSAPANTLAQYMFPFGEPGDLKYDAPAGQDLDGDSLTYSFTVDASRTMTPQKWNDIHSEDGIYRRITASLYASDGKDKSEPAELDLDLYYHPSAFFNAPGSPPGRQPVHRSRPLRNIRGTSRRFKYPDPVERSCHRNPGRGCRQPVHASNMQAWRRVHRPGLASPGQRGQRAVRRTRPDQRERREPHPGLPIRPGLREPGRHRSRQHLPPPAAQHPRPAQPGARVIVSIVLRVRRGRKNKGNPPP